MVTGLTFFVELAGDELQKLLERPGLLPLLQRLRVSLALAMKDLSAERREAMRELQARGIPLTAWLVVEEEQGYWLGVDNAARARQRCREVLGWAAAAGLELEAVGLDLEPPLDDARALLVEGRRALLRLLRHRRSRAALAGARRSYAALVAEVRQQGLRCETYQLPCILDERRAGTTILQRTLGLCDVGADREVVMLYETMLPGPLGPLLVASYGPDSQAIGVGLTGGGVPFVLELMGSRRLAGAELLAALRRARLHTPHLYVFSLEGCLERAGALEALGEGELEGAAAGPGRLPLAAARLVRSGFRSLLQAGDLLEAGLP